MMNRLLSGVKLVNRSHVRLRKYVTIGDPEAYKQLINSPNKKILYFTASWCPPCKMIGPVYENLSKSSTSIVFSKIDIDEVPEAAEAQLIRSVPTFQFWNGKHKIHEFAGADANLLRDSIKNLLEA